MNNAQSITTGTEQAAVTEIKWLAKMDICRWLYVINGESENPEMFITRMTQAQHSSAMDRLRAANHIVAAYNLDAIENSLETLEDFLAK